MSGDRIIIIMEYIGKRIRLSKGALDALGKQGHIKFLVDIIGKRLIIKPSREGLGAYTVPANSKEFLACGEIIDEIWRLNRYMACGREYMIEGRLDSQDKELVFNILNAVEVQREEIQQGQYYMTEIRKRQEYIDHALAVLRDEQKDMRCLKIYDLKTETLTFLRDLSSWDWVFSEENGNILEVMEQEDRETVLEKYQTIEDGFKQIVDILSLYEVAPYKEKKAT